MPRVITADSEAIEALQSRLFTSRCPFQIGLLIGRMTAARDFILSLLPTPPPETEVRLSPGLEMISPIGRWPLSARKPSCLLLRRPQYQTIDPVWRIWRYSQFLRTLIRSGEFSIHGRRQAVTLLLPCKRIGDGILPWWPWTGWQDGRGRERRGLGADGADGWEEGEADG